MNNPFHNRQVNYTICEYIDIKQINASLPHLFIRSCGSYLHISHCEVASMNTGTCNEEYVSMNNTHTFGKSAYVVVSYIRLSHKLF